MKYKNLFFILFGIIFVSCIFTTWIIHIPNPIYKDMGSMDSWINFFGSITGGLLTLAGVWWTIINQDKRRKEDIMNEYFPIPVVTNQLNYDLNVIDNLYSITFEMLITNVGKGPMFKIHRHKIPLVAATDKYKVTPQNYGICDPYNINVGYQIATWFPEVKLPITKDNSDKYYYFCSLKYCDAFNRTYEVYYKFKFKCVYNEELRTIGEYGPNDYEVITKEEFEEVLKLPEYKNKHND